MEKLLRLSQLIDTVNEWIGRLTYWLVLLMVAVGVWNVAGRYVGKGIGQNLTSNALIEVQWYLFAIVFFLGGAYALKHDEHVRVDVFYKGLNPKRKALINLLGAVLQTSFLTPPFGFALFYLRGVAPPSVKTAEIYRGAIPFILIQLFILVLIIAFPQIVSFLPSLKL